MNIKQLGLSFLFVIPLYLETGCANTDCITSHPNYDSVNLLGNEYTRPQTFQGLYQTSDQKELAFIGFQSQIANPHVALVYLHGIESHTEWFKYPAQLIQENGYDIYCLDRRGSGINRENRGYRSGHIDSYETLVSDIRSFILPLRQNYDIIVLIGLSWGGKLAVGYALEHPEDVDALVLITPGIKSKVYPNFLKRVCIYCLNGPFPEVQFKTPIEPEMFTGTPRFLSYIQNDPLRLTHASARFFYESHRLEKYIEKHISTNQLPIQLFLAEHDQIIDSDAVVSILQQGQQEMEIRLYEDQTHSIQFDAPRRMVNDLLQWVDDQILHETPMKEE